MKRGKRKVHARVPMRQRRKVQLLVFDPRHRRWALALHDPARSAAHGTAGSLKDSVCG
jgi:hypothetical protein